MDDYYSLVCTWFLFFIHSVEFYITLAVPVSLPHSYWVNRSILSSCYCLSRCFLCSTWVSTYSPDIFQKHASRWTGFTKLPQDVNECVIHCDGLRPTQGVFLSSDSGMSSRSTATLTRIKPVLKTNELFEEKERLWYVGILDPKWSVQTTNTEKF